MTNFNDFSLPPIKINRSEEPEALACPKCKCAWFEQILVTQFVAEHYVMIGQKVPPLQGSADIIVLRCLTCQNIVVPTILRNQRDNTTKSFDLFLDELDRKNAVDPTDPNAVVVNKI
jgi:hypothetical protein